MFILFSLILKNWSSLIYLPSILLAINIGIIEFIKEYNKIPWKQIIGMRNRIVHGYDTINLEIVWSTAIESIPELKSYCKEILG